MAGDDNDSEAERHTVGGIARPHAAITRGRAAERRAPGSGQFGCDDVANDIAATAAERWTGGCVDRTRGVCAAERCMPGVNHLGGGGINLWRVGAASAHPMEEGVVPCRLESLSAQDHVDSGDEMSWSGLRMSQVGEAEYNDDGMWLEGTEYAVPRPPKKPGGCLRINGGFLWFFLWFFFLVLECGDSTTTVST